MPATIDDLLYARAFLATLPSETDMPPDYAAMIAPHANHQQWRCLKCDARDDGTLMDHARACPERGEDTPERFACVYIIQRDPTPSKD